MGRREVVGGGEMMVPYFLFHKWAPTASRSHHRHYWEIRGSLLGPVVSIFVGGDKTLRR